MKAFWGNRNLHWVLNDKREFELCRIERAPKVGEPKTEVQTMEWAGVEELDVFGSKGKANGSKVMRKVARDR